MSDALTSLVKKEFLIRDQSIKGIYYLQPELMFKGHSALRTKLMNALVDEYITSDFQLTDDTQDD